MTREEAIEVIKEYRDNLIISPSNQLDGDVKAFDMAIQALSQEPCDDAISREDAIDAIYEHEFSNWCDKDEVSTILNDLPPVTQKSAECDDAISRILKRMWNCRGKHTTSIDKVKMEQIIRDELPSVTTKSIECDDAVSREAVLDALLDYWHDIQFVDGSGYDVYEDCKAVIDELPSVTQKSGKWIDREEYDADRWKCSICGRTEQYQERYCPNCGARMDGDK